MRKSVIKAKLAQGEASLAVQLHFTDPSVFELTSLMGFDGIWMDMEHHTYSLETAANLMRAARVGRSDIIARPAKGEFMRMGRMLEAGAQGIMYPRCDNAEEAGEVVRWAKFAPLGQRGFDSGNPDNPYCTMPFEEYIRAANDETFLIIQLEEQSAIDRAEEIAGVEGVDMIMLGPADFSVLSGVAGQFDHPVVQKAIEKIASAARNTGKNWAMPTFSLEHAQSVFDQGARLLFYSADIVMVKNALENMRSDFGKMGFCFGDDS